MSGFYNDGATTASEKFTIPEDCEAFEKLWELLCAQEYRRSLRDLLPKGTRIHTAEPGEFQWEVSFHFEDVAFSDGSSGSGEMLRIQNWYDEIDIYFEDERLPCWKIKSGDCAREVLSIIMQYA